MTTDLYQVLNMDCLTAFDLCIADNSIDAIVTDPPYGLEFMGRDWDAPWKSDRRQVFDGTLTDVRENPFGRSKVRYGQGASYGAGTLQMQAYQAWATEIYAECLRVLKPGGYLLSFGGSRTYHRMACAVEDAGFEIRDQIMWVYGSGFPKSHNGPWGGTALKPAHEPIVMARKPLEGTVEANWRKHGAGALNIDGCRVGSTVETWPKTRSFRSGISSGYTEGIEKGETQSTGTVPPGRWPANLIHDGSDEVLAAFPQASGAVSPVRGTEPSSKTKDVLGAFNGRAPSDQRDGGGSAARFFYCAKASKADRGEGNTHPTVKPQALMRYLVNLVTPKGGLVLDPFTGSGSTMLACISEGFKFIGFEREPEYVAITEKRRARAIAQKEAAA